MKTLICSQAGSLNAFVGFLFPLKILLENIKKGDDLQAEGFLLLFIRIVISVLFFFSASLVEKESLFCSVQMFSLNRQCFYV